MTLLYHGGGEIKLILWAERCTCFQFVFQKFYYKAPYIFSSFCIFALHILKKERRVTLNYKEIFHRIVLLLSSPAKAWNEIAERKEGRLVMPNFVYPMIGLCGLSEFGGAFIGREFTPDVFQVALTQCCAVAVALFGGFFLATYLIDWMGRRWFGRTEPYDKVLEFVGNSMVVTFVLDIVSGLFSIMLLHWILQIYTFVVVFEGARQMLKVTEEKLTEYTVATTLIVLICPALIEFVFTKLSVILN